MGRGEQPPQAFDMGARQNVGRGWFLMYLGRDSGSRSTWYLYIGVRRRTHLMDFLWLFF